MNTTRDERDDVRARESRIEDESVRNIGTYQNPLLAALKGRSVRVIATGDQAGHSPVCQVVDEDGRLQWVEQRDLTIIDPQYLPPSFETLRSVFRSTNR